ncbi:hypothetical protein TWF730_004338 [Orbilia blumenaviensis]|uniref:Uncharacterized protein n=1 Tax=Orbilia blumenaviensis TaxID=1796055 RepID=A0AAV9U0F9_9PEZI
MLRASEFQTPCVLKLFGFFLLFLPEVFAQAGCGDLIDTAAGSVPASCVEVGDVTVTAPSVATVNLRNVEVVSGDLGLRGPSIDSLDAASLVNITGDFTIQSSKLSQLHIPRLSSLGGDLLLNLSDSPLTNIGLGLSAVAVGGSYTFIQSPNIQRISLSVSPNAALGNRSLAIDGLYSLDVLEIDGIDFTKVNITATSLSSIPDIWASTQDWVEIYSLGLLGNISITTSSVRSSVMLAGIGSPSVVFPALATIGGDLNFIQTDTIDLSFPSLRSVSGGFIVSINDKLQSLSVGRVETISDLAFANNTLLANIFFPELRTLDILTIQYNDYMTVLDLQSWFPKLSQVSRYIILQGQFNNVTFPLLQNGIGIKAPLITIVSSVELDCEAVRSEAIDKQAISNIDNLECTSGPKGTKPSVTSSPARPGNPPPTPTGTSNNIGEFGGGNSSTNIGAIVGGTIGGVVFIAAISALVWVYMRRRPRGGGQHREEAPAKMGGIEEHVGGIHDPGRDAGGIKS